MKLTTSEIQYRILQKEDEVRLYKAHMTYFPPQTVDELSYTHLTNLQNQLNDLYAQRAR